MTGQPIPDETKPAAYRPYLTAREEAIAYLRSCARNLRRGAREATQERDFDNLRLVASEVDKIADEAETPELEKRCDECFGTETFYLNQCKSEMHTR